MNKHLILICIGLFIFALIPRAARQDYSTIDEAGMWVQRSEVFLDAIQHGKWGETAQAFHPGVTTMWLGAGGILIDRILYGEGHPLEDEMGYRANIRILMSVVNSLSITLGFLLLRRLINEPVALGSALLWAGNPFLVAHGGVLHVDGLSTSFMLLSFLTGLIAFHFDRKPYIYNSNTRWKWWIASAILGGLAALTKITTFAVIGILGFLMLFINWRHLKRGILHKQVGQFILWGIIAAITFFILYPAMWQNIDLVLERFDSGIEATFGGHWNFFLGERTINPGPLYYLYTVGFRITPWVMIGLFLTPYIISRREYRYNQQVLISLFTFILCYAAIMIVQRKQQGRYLLQIYPLMDIFAAIAWIWIIRILSKRFSINLPRSVWIAAILILSINLLSYHPYPRTYYNPLLGGAKAAENLIMVGDGEGMDKAATFILNQVDNPCDVQIVSSYKVVIQINMPCAEIYDADQWPLYIEEADYLVLYINHLQRDFYPVLEDVLTDVEPIYKAQISGINYAYVYDLKAAEIDWSFIDELLDS